MSSTPVASIDLHGYRKERAIEKVTQFLESIVQQQQQQQQQQHKTKKRDLWVCIITGSGSRSHDGPVLREAVRSLLNRREMQYSIQRGKGSFLVNAFSGHQPQGCWKNAVDSKVILVENRTRENDVKLVDRPPPPPSHSTPEHSFGPLPAQVAADDELFQKIKATSAHEHVQYVRQDQAELNKAISASQSHAQRLQQEEEEQLEAVLKQSQHEESLAQEQQEERLAAVLQRSLEDEERRRRKQEQLQREEEERLAVVLAASQQEEVDIAKQEEMLLERAISISQLKISSQQQDDMCAVVDCELEEVLKL